MKEVLVFGLGYNGKVFQVPDDMDYLRLCEPPEGRSFNSLQDTRSAKMYHVPFYEYASVHGGSYLIATSDPKPSRDDIEAAIRLKKGWDTGKTMKVIIDGEVVERPASEWNEPIVENGLIEVTTLNHTMPEFTSFRDEQ